MNRDEFVREAEERGAAAKARAIAAAALVEAALKHALVPRQSFHVLLRGDVEAYCDAVKGCSAAEFEAIARLVWP